MGARWPRGSHSDLCSLLLCFSTLIHFSRFLSLCFSESSLRQQLSALQVRLVLSINFLCLILRVYFFGEDIFTVPHNYTKRRDSTRMSDETAYYSSAPKMPPARQSPGTSSNPSPWSLGSSDANAPESSAEAAATTRTVRRPRLSWSARLQRATLERRARKMSAQYKFIDWDSVAEQHKQSRVQSLQASQVPATVQTSTAFSAPKNTHPIAPSRRLYPVSVRPIASAQQETLPPIFTVNFKV